MKQIGLVLDDLSQLRNKADYKLGLSGPFASSRLTEQAIQDANAAVALLDSIDGDPARQAAAIAAIRAAWP